MDTLESTCYAEEYLCDQEEQKPSSIQPQVPNLKLIERKPLCASITENGDKKHDQNGASNEDETILIGSNVEVSSEAQIQQTHAKKRKAEDSLLIKSKRKRGRPSMSSSSINLIKEEAEFSVKTFMKSPLKKSGMLYVLGQGDAGQLGLGVDVTELEEPKSVNINSEMFSQISCGGLHTVALSDKGTVYSCGCNDEGALGRPCDDETDYVLMPVKFPKNVTIKKIGAGDSFSVALTTHGQVYAWGAFRDVNGQIGLIKFKKIELTPVLIYDHADECVDVCAGTNHILMLTNSGKIFTCGCGDEGQLGRVQERNVKYRGGRRGISHLLSLQQVFIKLKIRKGTKILPFDDRVVRIFTGKCTSFAVLKCGEIFGWGHNNFHQLDPNLDNYVYFPCQLSYLLKRTCSEGQNGLDLIFAGGLEHTLILNTKTGRLFAVGNHFDGRLGCQGKQDQSEEAIISNPDPLCEVTLSDPSISFTDCACGDVCSFAVSVDGRLFSWGVGCNHQLGVGGGLDIFVPTCMNESTFQNNRVFCVSSGAQHTVFLTEP